MRTLPQEEYVVDSDGVKSAKVKKVAKVKNMPDNGAGDGRSALVPVTVELLWCWW